jgi:catechol 2,3-dioxygenase-like lactoylglutathione lyase family enzyme
MNSKIVHITLLVREYGEAIEFYTQKLDFELVEDTALSQAKRWVLVKPKGEASCALLLAKASDEKQIRQIGNQTGGRVFLFLHTDNFEREYHKLIKHNIEIVRGPVTEPYGRVLVFKDLYGNLWDLIEPKN